jgi:hypothetical protein
MEFRQIPGRFRSIQQWRFHHPNYLPAANRNPCIPGGLNVDLLRGMIFFTNSTKKLFFLFFRQLWH